MPRLPACHVLRSTNLSLSLSALTHAGMLGYCNCLCSHPAPNPTEQMRTIHLQIRAYQAMYRGCYEHITGGPLISRLYTYRYTYKYAGQRRYTRGNAVTRGVTPLHAGQRRYTRGNTVTCEQRAGRRSPADPEDGDIGNSRAACTAFTAGGVKTAAACVKHAAAEVSTRSSRARPCASGWPAAAWLP